MDDLTVIYLIYWWIFLYNIKSLEKYLSFIQFILDHVNLQLFSPVLFSTNSYIRTFFISKPKTGVAAQLFDAVLMKKFVSCSTSE